MSYCSVAFYDIPSEKTNLHTSLGYGYKSDFTQGDRGKPGPDKYNLKSSIELSKEKLKGPKFALGRDVII